MNEAINEDTTPTIILTIIDDFLTDLLNSLRSFSTVVINFALNL